jgi:gas vesicle protein
MSRGSSSNEAVFFLAGAAVGAAVALLFAPQTGEKTRRMLARRANESGRDLIDRGRELYDKSRDLADEAADMFERGKKLVQS